MANKRLIDANKIPYHKSGFPKGDGLDGRLDWAFRDDIDKMPTVDAVEVCRCKDCVYWTEHDGEMFCSCWANLMTDTAADDFCSYGERREGE